MTFGFRSEKIAELSSNFSFTVNKMEQLMAPLEEYRHELQRIYQSYEPKSENGEDISHSDNANYGKAHQAAKNKYDALSGNSSIIVKLKDAKNIQEFNKLFNKLSPVLSVQRHSHRFQESTTLTKTEEILRDIRIIANKGKDDMFVDVMHRLYQRQRTLELTKKNTIVNGKIIPDFKTEKKMEAMDQLIQDMKKMASYNNSMAFYITIIQWEIQIAETSLTHKDIMREKRDSRFYQPESISMLNNLKKALLSQAVKNRDITPDQERQLLQAMREGSESENTKLAELKACSDLMNEISAIKRNSNPIVFI